jgi:hypothetical protein
MWLFIYITGAKYKTFKHTKIREVHVTGMVETDKCIRKPEQKRQLGRPMHRGVDIIKTDLKRTQCGGGCSWESPDSGYSSVAGVQGSCVHINVPPGSIAVGKFVSFHHTCYKLKSVPFIKQGSELVC